jgi:hypothetical protein
VRIHICVAKNLAPALFLLALILRVTYHREREGGREGLSCVVSPASL